MPSNVEVIEERMKNLIEQINKDRRENCTDHEKILVEIEKLHNKLDNQFVTKQEFAPVRAIAYAIVTFVGMAVLTALVGLVIKR